MTIRLIGLILSVLMASTSAYAVDYDYEAARQKWEQKKRDLEAAETDLQRAKNDLVPLQRTFDRAQQKVNSLEQSLQNIRTQQRQTEGKIDNAEADQRRLENDKRQLERDIVGYERQIDDLEDKIDDLEDVIAADQRQLERLNRRISELEGQPNDNDWTCVYVDRGFEEHRGGHRATHPDKATAQEQAEAACLESHGECRLSSCTQPDNEELARLKRERDALQTKIQ